MNRTCVLLSAWRGPGWGRVRLLITRRTKGGRIDKSRVAPFTRGGTHERPANIGRNAPIAGRSQCVVSTHPWQAPGFMFWMRLVECASPEERPCQACLERCAASARWLLHANLHVSVTFLRQGDSAARQRCQGLLRPSRKIRWARGLMAARSRKRVSPDVLVIPRVIAHTRPACPQSRRIPSAASSSPTRRLRTPAGDGRAAHPGSRGRSREPRRSRIP
jgi:hypothetical protein